MKSSSSSVIQVFLVALVYLLNYYVVHLEACRVGSEILKLYTKKSIESYLDGNRLRRVYWQDEPVNAESLSQVTGLNITLAETHFSFDIESHVKKSLRVGTKNYKRSEIVDMKGDYNHNRIITDNENQVNGRGGSQSGKLIQDIFVTCSADRDRSYTLTINLELDNPFKIVDFTFGKNLNRPRISNGSNQQFERDLQEVEMGIFRIYLPQSTFLVQLNQRIRYDECLDVEHVQLGPNINYDVECVNCNDELRSYLDKILSKKMSQFDAELDSILSEKLLFGLQLLLNQKRLDLDLFLI